MKKLKVLFFLILLSGTSFSQVQTSVSIYDCYKNAIEKYPLSKQKKLLKQAKSISRENINKEYLPKINLNANASYQSDVITLPLDIPNVNIPTLSKDRYNFSFDINQLIYNFGIVEKQKKLDEINYNIKDQEVEIELFKLKQRINDIFFSIVLLKEKRKILENSIQVIKSKLQAIQSGVENGLLLNSDANVLKSEILKIEQKIIEIDSGIMASILSLKDLTGIDISYESKLIFPDLSITDINTQFELRPEFHLFDLYNHKIDAAKDIISVKNKPNLFGYASVGYGKPGLDMMSDDFNTFYIVGLGLSWNIWDWNKYKAQKNILSLQNKIIDTQKETFNKNLSVSLIKNLEEINKYKALILKDKKIIKLCSDITKVSSSRLDNGVITSSDYIKDMNEEMQAKLNFNTHKILLVISKMKYLETIGKF
ncbi:MAG: TolC family protein [Bacteroidales bacterium]|nr:TolC family protein [Bacteroidales bacterium]